MLDYDKPSLGERPRNLPPPPIFLNLDAFHSLMFRKTGYKINLKVTPIQTFNGLRFAKFSFFQPN